jgi:CMP-N-acetylneuraminic acid synthetase
MIPGTGSDNDPRIAAIVPMRHFSRRVPGKNYRLLIDKPLYRYILDTLFAVPAVTEVVVDTDSDTIIDELRRQLPEVRIIRRPEHLRSEMLVMNDILPHILEEVEADYYLQTHSTNPLLRRETIAEAITAFLAQRETYDSLFSVTPRHVRLWTAEGKAVNHDPDNLIRTQDLEPVMEENSCIYIFGRDVFEARRNRIGARPLVFAMDAAESLDVDTELDWQVVEATLRAAEGSRA